ncbi:hypothetical protein MRX96_016602 [Rhipicephalus microplus]
MVTHLFNKLTQSLALTCRPWQCSVKEGAHSPWSTRAETWTAGALSAWGGEEGARCSSSMAQPPTLLRRRLRLTAAAGGERAAAYRQQRHGVPARGSHERRPSAARRERVCPRSSHARHHPALPFTLPKRRARV